LARLLAPSWSDDRLGYFTRSLSQVSHPTAEGPPLRILQVHNRYRNWGGEDTVVETEAQLLREAGHEVAQWTTRNPEAPAHAAAALLVSPWNPIQYRRALQVARRVRPDIVHLHNTWFGFSPSVVTAFGKLGLPVVMTIHNYRLMCANALLFREGKVCRECVGRSPWRSVAHGCYRDSRLASLPAAATIALNHRLGTWLRYVERFVALSNVGRRELIRAGFPAERIVVKPNTIPDPGRPERSSDTSRTVLCIGRLTEEKGLSDVLEAWPVTEQLDLVIIGDGPLRGPLSRAHPWASFLGQIPREDVLRWLSRARAVVFPSRWFETFGMVPLEAFAHGVPVLASEPNAGCELTRHLGDDWVVGLNQTWEHALRRLVDDSFVAAGGEDARRTYLQYLGPPTNLTRLLSIYRGAIK